MKTNEQLTAFRKAKQNLLDSEAELRATRFVADMKCECGVSEWDVLDALERYLNWVRPRLEEFYSSQEGEK